MPIASFVLTAYAPLTLWRHTTNYSRLLSSNYGLLYHRQVTVLDILIARTLTEIVSVGAAAIIVYFVLLSIGMVEWIENPALVLVGWLLMSWFGFGVGCVIAGLSEKYDAVDNLIQPAQYLILPLSGCFFMVSWLPHSVQEYAVLFPMINIFECFRAGFFGAQVQTFYSIGYVVAWSVVMTALGLKSVTSARARLAMR